MFDRDLLLQFIQDEFIKATNNILEVVDRRGDAEEYVESATERSVYGLLYDKIVKGDFDAREAMPKMTLQEPTPADGAGSARGMFEDNPGQQPDSVCDTCSHADEEICNIPGTDCLKVK